MTLVISAGLHLSFAGLVDQVLSVPEIDIALQVPFDVELGLTEEVALAAPSSTAMTPIEPSDDSASAPSEPNAPPEEPEPDARRKKKKKPTPDAGIPHGGDAGPEPARPDAEQVAAANPPGSGPDTVGARLPPGAQIALRVDMARVRASAVADDLRALLAAIPDWQALLDGSGISPVDQLDRLLIATPDLRREKVVLAGRYVGERHIVRDAVAQLAATHGSAAPWHAEEGVEVARWLNRDATPRVIALVGPQHFTISRIEDLPRVLAIAAARVVKKGRDVGPVELPADALLSMQEGEGLSLEVDGVERFIRRGRRGVPTRLRIAAIEVPGPAVSVRARLVFADAELAADGLRFWEAVRQSYGHNALVGLLGLSQPLSDAVLELEEHEIHVRVELSVEQMRLILGYVRELITPPPPVPSAIAPAASQGGATP